MLRAASGTDDDARELADLRTKSTAYKALIRNMIWNFERKGLVVRLAGAKEGGPDAVVGETPTLTAASEKALFIVEFATGPMLRNRHLSRRLHTFESVAGARRWLVVPSDDWAEARAFIEALGIDWQVVSGDR